MELIKLSIQEDQIYQHSNAPLLTRVEQGIPCGEMHPITWHRVVALGFDMEGEDERAQKLSLRKWKRRPSFFWRQEYRFRCCVRDQWTAAA